MVAVVAPGIVLALPGAVFACVCIPFALRHRRITAALEARRPEPTAAGRVESVTPGDTLEGINIVRGKGIDER
jgi:hypothetical protein